MDRLCLVNGEWLTKIKKGDTSHELRQETVLTSFDNEAARH
jgi:hypothetical protein